MKNNKYKCKKGLKKVKVTKAEEGLASVAPKSNEGLATGLNIAGGVLGAVLPATNPNAGVGTKTGAAIGSAAGQAANMLVPGLGGLVSPITGVIGGTIGGLINNDEDKADRAKKKARYESKLNKLNSGVQTDLTSFQANQYPQGSKKVKVPKVELVSGIKAPLSDFQAKDLSPYKTLSTEDLQKKIVNKSADNLLSTGFRTKAQIKGEQEIQNMQDYLKTRKSGSTQQSKYSKGTKVIEIEGKTTPEIHTDSNFNLKNLGTTPHSKGGNKVIAEEGDVVFPTQNSPKKYNEIMNAIMKKDKYKLKKEQNKLPEDKDSKYPDGTKKVKKYTREEDPSGFKSLKDSWGNSLSKIGSSFGEVYDGTLGKMTITTDPNYAEKHGGIPKSYAQQMFEKYNKNPNKKAKPYGEGKPNVVVSSTNPKARTTGTSNTKSAAKVPVSNLTDILKPKIGSNTNADLIDLPKENLTQSQIDGRAAEASYKFPTKIENKETSVNGGLSKDKSSKKFDANSALELAPIAYNLEQGLFGNVEKVNRREFKPELERYTDTSGNMRREVNQNYKSQLSNSRNLSGGLVSNIRANNQVAANAKLGQVNQIDSQEYGKQLDINNRNTQTINNSKLTNLELNNRYDDLDSQNRAKKSEALTTGLTDLGQLGSRNKLMNNQLQAQTDALNILKKGTSYKINSDANGQNLDLVFDSGTGIPTSGLGLNEESKKKKTNSRSRLGVQFGSIEKEAKGVKSLKVERRYKLKN